MLKICWKLCNDNNSETTRLPAFLFRQHSIKTVDETQKKYFKNSRKCLNVEVYNHFR